VVKKDNSTGKSMDFYDKGQAIFDRMVAATAALKQPPIAHSKSEYKRMKALGADVLPPAETKEQK
tara:strand:+ start:330 stop:524 length:195 start_codon:yes stop_codon:yes gene_type:complete